MGGGGGGKVLVGRRDKIGCGGMLKGKEATHKGMRRKATEKGGEKVRGMVQR